MATVTNITGPILQPGTTNEYYVKWVFTKKYTDHFSYRWQYMTPSNVWFEGSSGQVDYGDGNVNSSTYSPPETATYIRFAVKPVASKYTPKKKKKEVSRYTGTWSSWRQLAVTQNVPDNPSAPTVSMENNVLTAHVDIYDGKTTKVTFQLVKDDTALYKSGTANLITNRATIQWSGLPDGSKFKVRCIAYNSKNVPSREWSNYSSEVYTRLMQITGNIYLEKLTKTLVKISLQYPVVGAEQYEIEYAIKESYLGTSQSETVTEKIVGNYFLVSITEGDIYYFRIRGKSSKVSVDAPWSKVVSIAVGSPPTAPTTWSSVSSVKIGEQVILYWVHNSQDKSKERSAVISFTTEEKGTWEVTINNPYFDDPFAPDRTSQYIFETSDFEVDTEVFWAVKTRGVVDEYGPFSTTKSFKVSVPPSVTLQLFKRNKWFWNPFDFEEGNINLTDGEYVDPYEIGEPVTKFPIFVGAEVQPVAQRPLEANFSIYSMQTYETEDFDGTRKYVAEGEMIFSKNMEYRDIDDVIGWFHLPIMPTDVLLVNGMTYKLVCTVVMGSGLSATAEVIFTMDLEDPNLDVDAQIEYDEVLKCCYIRAFCLDEEEQLVPRVYLSVYRQNFDGEFVAIGKDLNNMDNITIIDPHPTLSSVKYRIVGQFMETGGLYFYDLPAWPIEETSIIIQWEEEWKNFEIDPEYEELAEPEYTGNILILPYNIDISDSSSPDVSLVEYIGRSHPVAYYGTQIGQTASWSSEIPHYDEDTIFKIRQLQRYMGDCYVREPNGAGYWANISITFTKNHLELKIPVSIEVKRVEGGI